MNYVLGLDLGISSIGWAILNNDDNKIEKIGVRIFTPAENPKDGKSLATPRREARLTRRRLNRKRKRINKIKTLFLQEGIITPEELQGLAHPGIENPYQLRVKGLTQPLSPTEWARCLLHIAKWRGFKSNRKSEKNIDKEKGNLTSGIAENKKLLSHYTTIAEMLLTDPKFQPKHSVWNVTRNKKGNYINSIGREDLEAEIHILFQRQRKLGNPHTSEQLKIKYLEWFNYQENQIEGEELLKKVASCVFEKNEKRAPANCYSIERFILLQTINNLQLIQNGVQRSLTKEQRQIAINLAYEKEEPKYKDLRKALELPENTYFKNLNYNLSSKKDPEDSKFIYLRGYHSLKKVVAGTKNNPSLGIAKWKSITQNTELLDTIAYALTVYKTDSSILTYLKDKGISEEYINAVLTISFDKFKHLSLKACRRILPYLEDGYTYSTACELAGYNHTNTNTIKNKSHLLPPLSEETKLRITNPVALRAISQARKLINAIIKRYGSPYAIHIELAREIGKSKEDRDKIINYQKANEKEKETIRNDYKEKYGRQLTETELLKLRLWYEQNGFCAYSYPSSYITIDEIFQNGACQIDHILPFSRSLDNGFTNKFLVRSKENQNKGNRIPYEYFGHDEKHWHYFEEWVLANIKNRKKQDNLLRRSFTKEEASGFRERNLNDTRIIATTLATWIRQNLLFSDPQNKQPVRTFSGQITAYLRYQWGLAKNRNDGDYRHHAQDAAVIAAATKNMEQQIIITAKTQELFNIVRNGYYIDPETNEVLTTEYKVFDKKELRLPMPWPDFKIQLKKQMDTLFVSRQSRRNVTGKAHKDTICGQVEIDGDLYLKYKCNLEDLTLAKLENIYQKERNLPLYNKLKIALIEHEKNRKRKDDKPFQDLEKNPFFKNNDGTGPIVRSITLLEKSEKGVPVHKGKGIAGNTEIVRTDVYKKDNKYYLVPFYPPDIKNPPDIIKAITAGKPKNEWTKIDESYTFLFSLYKYDLVYIKLKNIDPILGYYISVHSNTGTISIIHPNKNEKKEGIGVKTAQLFQRLEVDILGNYTQPK